MKRLFILSNIYEKNTAIGITKKVHQQIDAFRRLGYNDIVYTGYLDDGVAVFDNEGNIIKFKKYRFQKQALVEITKNYTLKKLCKEYMKDCEPFDLVYSRYLFFDPYFLGFLRKASMKTNFLTVEAHCYPFYEKGSYKYYPIYLLDKLFINSSKKYIDLVAGITDIKNIWDLPTVNIDNGIVLSDYKLQSLIKKNQIDLIFIGYEYRMHGVDRMLNGLKEYYDKNNQTKIVNIHLVGKFMESTHELVKQLDLQNYVFFEGVMYGKELDMVFDQCELAVGVLAPHRKKSNIGTGLKTKEYIARGLPQIYAGASMTLAKDWPYAYTVASNEAPIDVAKYIEYYEELRTKDKDYSIHMREYAQTLTWDNEIKKILEQIE